MIYGLANRVRFHLHSGFAADQPLRRDLSSLLRTFHYTDKQGWNGIRSQQEWIFKASQPPDPDRPFGAYFTDIEPTTESIRTVYKRIRVPKVKQEYVFRFTGRQGLTQLYNGRGRDKRIYFSPIDYNVSSDRHEYAGATADLLENRQ